MFLLILIGMDLMVIGLNIIRIELSLRRSEVRSFAAHHSYVFYCGGHIAERSETYLWLRKITRSFGLLLHPVAHPNWNHLGQKVGVVALSLFQFRMLANNATTPTIKCQFGDSLNV